ncbi:MAG: LEA type 2 family protein [Zoogloea sp.]|nr:LEA type 2 family protein [Zoogloea sp.]
MKRRDFLSGLGAALLAGCAALPVGLDAPEVSLANINLVGGNLLEQRFALQLRVRNPNRRDIDIKGLNFQLELQGQRFASGTSDHQVTLPALGETLVDVSVVATLADVLRIVREVRKEGGERVAYGISGKLFAGMLPGGLPFQRRGEVSLAALRGL